MPETTITTDLDLHELANKYRDPIPARVMKDIGMAFIRFRKEEIWAGRNLHDGSPLKPLKPETIKAKRGERDTSRAFINKSGRASKVSVRGPSIAPEKPLIDTGDLAGILSIAATDGNLVLTPGSRSAAYAGYHTADTDGRVHMAWSPYFVYEHPKGVAAQVANYYKTEIQKIAREIKMR
jgi:hypothetical protein